MPWIKRELRGNPVFVRVDAEGTPAADDTGRVEIVYKMSPGAKVYRASVNNLKPTGDAADDTPFESDIEPGSASAGNGDKPAAQAAVPTDAIVIYTDGACTGNPGPMGIGYVVIADGERHEHGEFLGEGTNNIAELTAIQYALEHLPPSKRKRTVVLHTDSSYSIGVLSKGWKAKANVELVGHIRGLVEKFPDLRFVKVKGHAGIPDNERCDELATAAIENASPDAF